MWEILSTEYRLARRRWRHIVREKRAKRFPESDRPLLALAVLGVRCAVTLPCFFLLADASMETSAALARASFGRGRHTAPVVYGRRCWIRLGIVLAALTVGLCVELLLSPRLLTLALERAVI